MGKDSSSLMNHSKQTIRMVVCFCTAFLFSYSIAVHFLHLYSRSASEKILLLLLLAALLGFLFYFIWEKIEKKRQYNGQNLARRVFIFSLIPLLFLGIYFYFYYEPPPFLTSHQLQITNISGDTGGEDWKPVEIIRITYLDGASIPVEDLSFLGEHWIAEGSILLKPSSAVQFSKTYVGAANISFRSDPDQGQVSIVWDGQEQSVDLAVGDESIVTVSLTPNSWGKPGVLWQGMAVLSLVSDFVCIFLSILFVAVFFLDNYDSEIGRSARSQQALKFNKTDLLIILFLVGISLILSKNLFGGHFMDYTALSGDAGNYASFAAAKAYPELFVNDPLLSDAGNFNVYSTYHAYLTQVLASLFGNFGSAFMVLQLPLTIMQLCGFYLLGRELYGSRLFGFILAALSFIFVQINLSEFWGYVTSPIPRFSFQAILPFLLLLVLKNGSAVKRWPFLMAFTAATVYVHLVSAPAWSAAIILALWFMAPRSVPFSQKFKYMAIGLAIFLLVLSPFIVKYFQNTAFGEQDANSFSEVYAIIDYRLAQGMVDFHTAMEDFFHVVLAADGLHGLLFVGSMLSLVGMNFIARDDDEKRNVRAVTMWVAGILSVSILFPMVDFAIAKILQRNPLEIQFLRALRNFMPLFYILFLWPFAVLFRRGEKKFTFHKVMSVVFCVGFLILWCNENEFFATPLLSRTLTCWKEGRIICPENEELAVRDDFFSAVKDMTPSGSRILSDDLAIRYYSLRPLAFSKKDGATFSFSNHAALLDWYEKSLLYDELGLLKGDWDQYIVAYVHFAQVVDADYVVVERAFSSADSYPANLALVYTNDGYSLFELAE